MNDDKQEDREPGDDADTPQPPYLPFEEARAYVRRLGLRTQREWLAWAASPQRPPDIPKWPETTYAEYVDLKDWLGTRKVYRSFQEAREYARSLGITKFEEWKALDRNKALPPDIPKNPQDYYKGQGFSTWKDFLGRTEPTYLPFEEARAFVRSLGLKNKVEWRRYAASADCPAHIPRYPEQVYKDKGWVTLDDWLGNANRWTAPLIKAFLESIKGIVRELQPAELFAILRKKGLIESDFRKNSNRAVLTALERLCRTAEPEKVIEDLTTQLDPTARPTGDVPEAENPPEEAPPGEAQPTGEDTPAETGPDDQPPEVVGEELTRVTRLPTLRTPEELDVADTVAEYVTDDGEVLDFLVYNRVAALWQAVLNNEPGFSLDEVRRRDGGTYFRLIRERFLEEYEATVNLPVPTAYSYHKNGRPAPPLLMQRLIAYRVLKQHRVGNWSGVGAGKTVSAVLAALVVDAELTVVVAFNSTLENWEREILAVCPAAQVVVKDRGPFSFAPGRPAFVVMNYESFQQEWAETDFIPNVLSANRRLDFVVIDEIQSVRQRSKAEESTRRRVVRKLLEEGARRNPALRVLGMSATPVINDLHESRVTLEMVTGQDMCELPVKFSVSNAITHHQLMIRHGVRFRPKEESKVDEQVVEVDGSALKDDLARLKIKVSNIAYLEQTLLKAKLPVIANHLTPGTLIYTQFVEGMVDEMTGLVKRLGLSVGVFTGDQKDGLDKFRGRLDPAKPPEQRCDVLIGSAPVGTGIDGLQQVGDQIIFACLPWTSAEYEQVVGRLNRKGVAFDRIKVVIPHVILRIDGQDWSWDRYRLQCIRYKRTLADAVIDGVVPEGRLPTRDEMYRQSMAALQDWITQVERADAT